METAVGAQAIPRKPVPNPDEFDANMRPHPAPVPSAAMDETMLTLLEHSRDCVKILGLEGTLDFMHCGGCDVLENEEFSGLRGKVWWTLWPAHTQSMVHSMFERARSGRDVSFTAQCPTRLGNVRSWMVNLRPMITDNGAVVGVLCTSRDREEAASQI
jgi:hypothetical protein